MEDQIDCDKIAKILSSGGSLYMHPDDVIDLQIQATRRNKSLVLDKIISSLMVPKGSVVACNQNNLLLHGE